MFLPVEELQLLQPQGLFSTNHSMSRSDFQKVRAECAVEIEVLWSTAKLASKFLVILLFPEDGFEFDEDAARNVAIIGKEEFLLLKRLISQWEMRSSCTKISFSIKSKRGKEDESECSSFLIKEVRSYSLIWFYEESRNCLQKHSLSQNGAWMQKAETYLAENILSLQTYALKARFPSRPWWTSPCLAELGNRTQF